MITLDLLAQVGTEVVRQQGAFTVDDIGKALDCKYDNSLVREAIWYLIDRGKVDITPDRKFVATRIEAQS
jgi:hypothetical protein